MSKELAENGSGGKKTVKSIINYIAILPKRARISGELEAKKRSRICILDFFSLLDCH